jgi:signal transduction histidine kinase
LFRIFQESLTNVARHAEAKKVSGILQLVNDSVILTISDDGKGFDPNLVENKKSLGLLGMKERTQLMNGVYEIDSSPGSGTEVRVKIPIST